MNNRSSSCVFCNLPNDRIITESDTCLVIYDGYPVTELHTLIIPKRHAETYFDLTADERRDIEGHLEKERKRILKSDSNVTGFNIGMNNGEDAGQTVMHCHVHLIPRRKGDIDDPRGGVRGVIPDKRIY
jgi:ATP adenylyltransferase